MGRYEYRVLPAPRRPGRVKARGSDGKAAATLEAELNALAAEGWDYVRADTLPFDERTGLTQRTTVFHTFLVFRRSREEPVSDPPRAALPRPTQVDEDADGDRYESVDDPRSAESGFDERDDPRSGQANP